MVELDKKHAVTAVVAAVVASVIGGGVAKMVTPPPEKQQIVVNSANKPSPYAWGDLSQKEVDGLTSLLKATSRKFEVAIFCADQYCDSLALDFDNAFETAKWKSGIERPISDSNTGINVAPNDARAKQLAEAISKATNGRLKPGIIDAVLTEKDRVALVISRKPK